MEKQKGDILKEVLKLQANLGVCTDNVNQKKKLTFDET